MNNLTTSDQHAIALALEMHSSRDFSISEISAATGIDEAVILRELDDAAPADAWEPTYEINAVRPDPPKGKVTPPTEKRQICAQPNCAYFCQQRADDRILKLRHAYAEYVDACDAEYLIAYSFKSFCAKLRAWKRKALVQEQPRWLPGECMVTYWSRLEICGIKHWAFVAQMVVSDATFICRSDGCSPRHWMQCCERAYRYFGSIPHITDCSVFGATAGGVTRCVRATLEGFANYYRTVLFGARPKTGKTAKYVAKPLGPKNSSPVLRAIRKDLAESDAANAADIDRLIEERLDYYNKRKYVCPKTRWDTLVERELPKMVALPEAPYDMAIWDFHKVPANYHITLARAKYSVPHTLIGQEVRIRYTDSIVVAYHGGIIVAQHERIDKDFVGKRVHTDESHRPNGHRWFARRMDFRFKEMAEVCGNSTVKVMKILLARCKAEGNGYRPCKELIDLRHAPSAISLDQACAKVLADGATLIDITAIRTAMGLA